MVCLLTLITGSITMKNEIAQLLDAHTAFWRDLYSLSQDINYLIKHSYKWTHYESNRIENNCFYDSFYGEKNKLLFVLFDLTVDIPYLQLAMFHLMDQENEESDVEVSMSYLDENWKKTDPRFYIYNKNNEIIKTQNRFSIVVTQNDREYYTFSPKIDLLSIESNEVIKTDLNILIKSLIEDDNENYCPRIITFIE